MGLHSYTIDLDSSGFQSLDDIQSGGSFVACRLNVVVVVVELDIWVVFSGGGECDGDVFGTDLSCQDFLCLRSVKLTVL